MRFYTPFPRADVSLRLFCFPHAGGTAAAYTGWARALEAGPVEIVAAQLPGRDGRSGEAHATGLDEIVDGLADAAAQMLDRRYAFFGHSLGALTAFELARRLRDRGLPRPTQLFVSGAFAPQLPNDAAPLRFIEGDTAFLEAVAMKYGGVPKIVLEQAQLRASLVPALRADLALTETYVYRAAPRLDCAIRAYAGAADPIVTEARLSAWREQTTGEFSMRLFSGHHFYLNRARDTLLADVLAHLFRPDRS
jgi:surfactin synthase thioesterase subunit